MPEDDISDLIHKTVILSVAKNLIRRVSLSADRQASVFSLGDDKTVPRVWNIAFENNIMTTYFDRKEIAEKKFEELKREVEELKKKDITPKLVSILVGQNPGSVLYLSLKKAAGRIGCGLEIEKFPESESVNSLIKLIKKLNRDEGVHGIMVQLPLPGDLKLKTGD